MEGAGGFGVSAPVDCGAPAHDTGGEARVLDWMNDSGNRSHFNRFWHNCADFAGSMVSVALAEPVRRSYVADAGMMTPKQVVHRMQELGRRDPSLDLGAYVIPQVRGKMRLSGHIDDVTEAFVKTKPYLLPLAIIQPIGIGSVARICDRRHWPATGTMLEPAELRAEPAIPADGENRGLLRQQAKGPGEDSRPFLLVRGERG